MCTCYQGLQVALKLKSHGYFFQTPKLISLIGIFIQKTNGLIGQCFNYSQNLLDSFLEEIHQAGLLYIHYLLELILVDVKHRINLQVIGHNLF